MSNETKAQKALLDEAREHGAASIARAEAALAEMARLSKMAEESQKADEKRRDADDERRSADDDRRLADDDRRNADDARRSKGQPPS